MRSAGLFLLLLAGCKAADPPPVDWPTTGGAPGNARYSPLDQINITNVAQLQVAWVYHTGDLPPDGHGEIQATPIVVDGVLYATTPKVAVIAVRADKGTLLWRFDAFPNRPTQPHVNRGVVYWMDERGHNRRIFFAVDRRLYALDAQTGAPILSFGDSGRGWVDLGEGLGRDIGGTYLVSTSPGVAYKDVLIWGTRRARRRVTSARMTRGPEQLVGPSTRFPGRLNSATTPGRPRPSRRLVAPIPGPA